MKRMEGKEIEPTKDNPIDNRIELVKYTSEVQSRIKKDISSDFVLAKLEPKDKEAIVEMVSNAYFCRSISEMFKKKSIEQGKWIWNHKEEMYDKVAYSKEYLNKLSENSRSCFDSFMSKIYMVVILNRNVSKNHLLRMLNNVRDDEYMSNEEEDDNSSKGLKSKIRRVMKRNGKEKDKEVSD